MTNGWIDIKNTDMMLIMGGNPAENHPCGFKWPIEAKLPRNAKMIVVDPRFTRTAAHRRSLPADPRRRRHRLPRRPDQLRDREQPHRPRLPRQLHERRLHRQGGLQAAGGRPVFGLRCRDAGLRQVDLELRGGRRSTAARPLPRRRPRQRRSRLGNVTSGRRGSCRTAAEAAVIRRRRAGARAARAAAAMLPPNVAYDLSLQHPRCVFQLLKQQYSRYTPEMVERITGIPKDQFLKAADLFTSDPQRRRHEEGRARSSTRSAGRSTPSARRSSAPRRSCSCCWATSAAPAAASTRCAATRTSRARPTWPASSTSCPAI